MLHVSCAQSKPEVQAFFGLPDSEELLEKFQCTLVQSYACTNNHFTTPRLVRAAPPTSGPMGAGAHCRTCPTVELVRRFFSIWHLSLI